MADRRDDSELFLDGRTRKRQKILSSTASIASKTNSIATEILLEDARIGLKEGNFVFSPWSLESILSMLAAGAEGQTLEQLLAFLGLETVQELRSMSPKSQLYEQLSNVSKNESDSSIISVANGVWVDKKLSPILPSYEELLDKKYKTQARPVDFAHEAKQVAHDINSWVCKETNGLIHHIVAANDFNEQTKIVFANALYFKGLWENQFKKTMTKKRDFHLNNGQTVRVPFMTSREEFMYGAFRSFKILQIPYKSDIGNPDYRFSMYIFLPKKKNGLQSLLEKFHSDPMVYQKDFGLGLVGFDELWIPKFKISHEFEAIKTLKQMGLTLPFESMNNGFTGIVDSLVPLTVSRIVQKSCIEVYEKGTKAAAVTIGMLEMTCAGYGGFRPPPITFVAEHPFMFMIREDASKAVFFIGTVLDPQKGH